MDIGHPTPGEYPDIYQIVRRQIGDEDADEAAVTLEGGSAAPDTWLVARVDGRVAACLQILEVEIRVGTVEMTGGSVEFVASDPQHEGKGLIRALMGRFHEVEAQRGSLIQVIEGIPYFYRRFGYEYVFPTPPDLTFDQPLPQKTSWSLREATPDDRRLVLDLQSSAQSQADVVVGHSPRTWEWIIRSPVYRVLLASGSDRAAVGRVCRYGDTAYVFDLAGDPEGAQAIVAQVSQDGPTHVLRRPPITSPLDDVATIDPRAYARYARVSNAAALLEALLPELNRRISHLDIEDRTTAISHYGSSIELVIEHGAITSIAEGGRMQAVFASKGLGVPPDLIATLILGPMGAEALRLRHPDVIFDRADPLWTALFPPQTIDVQTWVYP